MSHDRKLESSAVTPRDEDVDSLGLLLAELRVPVREGFASRVMSSLPAPAWKKSSRAQWLWAAAAVLLLFSGSAILLGLGDSALGGSAAAVAELLAATLSAGAGFAAASWSGLGHAVDAALDGSISALIGLGLAAVGANLLLLRLVRRRAHARNRSAE